MHSENGKKLWERQIEQYTKIATQVAEEDGNDEIFYQKIKTNKRSMGGTNQFHPVLGPIFLSMFMFKI